MINTFAWLLLGMRTLAIVILIEVIATGHSFASLFICILAFTYMYEKRRYENKTN